MRHLLTSAFFLLLLLPLCCLAADATPATGSAPAALQVTLIQLLLPVGTPIVLAVMKALTPRLPKWSIPILAGALPAVLDLIVNHGIGASMGVSALLGLAGVGVREVQHQIVNRPSAN